MTPLGTVTWTILAGLVALAVFALGWQACQYAAEWEAERRAARIQPGDPAPYLPTMAGWLAGTPRPWRAWDGIQYPGMERRAQLAQLYAEYEDHPARWDRPKPLCLACGSANCPAAGHQFVDACPLWQEAAVRPGYLTTNPLPGFEDVMPEETAQP